MPLTTESTETDVIAALDAHLAYLSGLTADLAIVRAQINHLATDPWPIPDPVGCTADDGLSLGEWMRYHGVTDCTDERWPRGPDGQPTPATHVRIGAEWVPA